MHTLEVRITGKTKLDLIIGALALVSVLRDWHARHFEGSPQWAKLGVNYEVKTDYSPPGRQ